MKLLVCAVAFGVLAFGTIPLEEPPGQLVRYEMAPVDPDEAKPPKWSEVMEFEQRPLEFTSAPVSYTVIRHLSRLDDEAVREISGQGDSFTLGDYTISCTRLDSGTCIVLTDSDGNSQMILRSDKQIDRMYLIDRYTLGLQYTTYGPFDGMNAPPSYICKYDIRTGEGEELPRIYEIEGVEQKAYLSIDYSWRKGQLYYLVWYHFINDENKDDFGNEVYLVPDDGPPQLVEQW